MEAACMQGAALTAEVVFLASFKPKGAPSVVRLSSKRILLPPLLLRLWLLLLRSEDPHKAKPSPPGFGSSLLPLDQSHHDDRKWADFELEDEGDLADLAAVPGGFETRPDEDGIKTVTNYLQNSKGETVKVVKRVRVTKVVHRVNRAVLERSNIPFFGIEADETSTAKAFTVRSVEEVPLEVSKETLLRAKFRDDDDDEDIQFADLNPAKTSRDLRQKFLSLQNDEDPVSPTCCVCLRGLARLRGSANDSLKDLESRRREEATIRVTNLSEDVKEEDLTELFGTIGKLERVFLAKHKDKKASKGFAFITYATRDMAAQAIRKLNRHGYDNLLLNQQQQRFVLVALSCAFFDSSGRVGQTQQPREVIADSPASTKRARQQQQQQLLLLLLLLLSPLLRRWQQGSSQLESRACGRQCPSAPSSRAL
ncbi:hypothetical protein Esti_004086 [Eimeria stiedai]